MPSTAPAIDNVDAFNARLDGAAAADVVGWAADTFGKGLVLSTSFGVQAAVMLHLVTRVVPRIPVVFVDTGYHFPETYGFADALTRRLGLNLKVYSAPETPAWFEQRHGKLWETDINRYDQLRKVEPMARALDELGATATLAGLRRQQTAHRRELPVVSKQGTRFKVAPILSWTGKDVFDYLRANDLPFHPLHEEGYASIGDWHSTRKISEGEDERAGRFNGLKQECGLHLPETPQEDASRFSSGL